jgi:hypothetical protein
MKITSPRSPLLSAGFCFVDRAPLAPGWRDCVLELPINGRLLREQNLREINRRALTISEGLANIFRMGDENVLPHKLLHETCSGTP